MAVSNDTTTQTLGTGDNQSNLVVDRYEWKIKSGEFADLTRPQSSCIDHPDRRQTLSVCRLHCPVAGPGLRQRRHRRSLLDDCAVPARADGQRLRQRVRVDVPVSWVVQTSLDVIHVEKRVKSADLVRPNQSLQRLQQPRTHTHMSTPDKVSKYVSIFLR